MRGTSQLRRSGAEPGLAALRPGEYLGWYDRTPRKAIEARIDEAMAAFHEKFGRWPEICLVHASELINHPRIRVVAASHLRPGYYWLGWDDEALARAS